MAELGVLSWNNEAMLSPHPLSRGTGIDALFLDANFVQFDGFIPVLNMVKVGNNTYSFTIQFDRVQKTVEVSKFDLTGVPYIIKFTEGSRYLGKLVLSADAVTMYDEHVNRTFNLNIEFLPFLVKSIPSNAGVYSIQGVSGSVSVQSDAHIWYDTSGQSVTINAVAVPSAVGVPYLKTINFTVGPTNNNVHFKDSETIKVLPNGSATIEFSLVGTGAQNLIVEQNNTIPTNPNPK